MPSSDRKVSTKPTVGWSVRTTVGVAPSTSACVFWISLMIEGIASGSEDSYSSPSWSSVAVCSSSKHWGPHS